MERWMAQRVKAGDPRDPYGETAEVILTSQVLCMLTYMQECTHNKYNF